MIRNLLSLPIISKYIAGSLVAAGLIFMIPAVASASPLASTSYTSPKLTANATTLSYIAGASNLAKIRSLQVGYGQYLPLNYSGYTSGYTNPYYGYGTNANRVVPSYSVGYNAYSSTACTILCFGNSGLGYNSGYNSGYNYSAGYNSAYTNPYTGLYTNPYTSYQPSYTNYGYTSPAYNRQVLTNQLFVLGINLGNRIGSTSATKNSNSANYFSANYVYPSFNGVTNSDTRSDSYNGLTNSMFGGFNGVTNSMNYNSTNSGSNAGSTAGSGLYFNGVTNTMNSNSDQFNGSTNTMNEPSFNASTNSEPTFNGVTNSDWYNGVSN